MRKSISSSIIAALLCSAPAMASEIPQVSPPAYNCDFEPSCEVAPGIYGKMSSPVTSKFNLSIGGFVKLDYAYNSVNFGNSGSLTPISGLIPRNVPGPGKQEQSIFTARQSRLWLKASGPTFMGAKTDALIEGDFYGDPAGAAESPQFRMRQAYGSLDWANTQVLFGQAYDIFGPMIASTVDFRSGSTTGTPNNPRVPQIRLTQKVNLTKDNTLSLVLGVQDPNQDGNNNNTALNATATNLNYGAAVNGAGQIMFSSKALGTAPGYFGLPMKPLTLGVFGLYGNSKVTAPAVAANKTVDSYGYGFYAFVPVLKSSDGKSRAMTIALEGQAYQAANMNFNATTATTVFDTTSANPNPAKGYGLAAQAMFYPTQELGITAGYGRRGAIDYDHYKQIDFAKSTTQYYGNVSYDMNAAVRVMAEYQHLETKYGNVTAGAPDLGSANVFRLAAFYFF